MAIIMDKDFYDSFFNYYGDMISTQAPSKILSDMLSMCNKECIDIALNIAKTSAIIDQNYSQYYEEAAARLTWELSDPDKLDQFLFIVAFVHTYASHPGALQDFLGVQLKSRKIYEEIAIQIYGKSDTKTIEKLKKIETKDTYSIQTSNPASRDRWFYDLAVSIGSYSKCYSRKIGAILVKDKSIISTGYNGPPRGIPTCDQRWFIDKAFKEKYGHHIKPDDKKRTNPEDPIGKCPRYIIGFKSGGGLGICPAAHAERNAIINAARFGFKTKGAKLYITCGIPCSPCLVEIINAGIKEIICSSLNVYDESGMYLLENSKLKIRLFDFLV